MNENGTFTLAHLADPHLSSLTGVATTDLLNKRILGYLSWYWRRRAEHVPEVLSALVRDLNVVRPDHTVVTGDLTHIGLPNEFHQARGWLDSLGPPSEITVIPGNHDAYISTAWDRTFALWEPFMASDPTQLDAEKQMNADSIFPSLRVRGNTALIGLSSATPSAPFLAVGTLGSEQLRRLEQILEETGRQDLCRILLIHHPPLLGTVGWRKRLTDSAPLCSVLARQGAELVLHGHTHRTSVTQIETPWGSIPTIGVPSASSCSQEPNRRAQYHVYQVTQTAEGWELLVRARGYSSVENRFMAEGETRLTVCRSFSVMGYE